MEMAAVVVIVKIMLGLQVSPPVDSAVCDPYCFIVSWPVLNSKFFHKSNIS